MRENTTFQLGGKFGVGRCGGIEKTSLISLTSEERRTRPNEERKVPGNPRDMITVAERRFPVRTRVGVPLDGFGQRYAQITAWLDENCGADGRAMTPSGMRGVLNDAVSIYFLDATLANAVVARCAGYKLDTVEGVFRVRADEPAARTQASMHRTP